MSLIRKWWLVAVSLIIGFCIYLLFRQNVYFIELLFGIHDGVCSHWDLSHPLVYLTIYCLPDGLWYLALLNTNDQIGKLLLKGRNTCTESLNLVVIGTPFLLEAGQGTGCLAGTFDVCDILTYVFILIMYYSWIKKKLVLAYK